MLVSGLILALYSWVFFIGAGDVTSALLVNDYAAIVAGLAFVAGFVSYMWTPQSSIFITSLVGYYLLVIMVGLLLIDTGFITSPFIALWMLLCVFAPAFGLYGSVVVLGLTAAYLGLQYSSQQPILTDVGAIVLVAVFPVIVGYLFMSRNGPHKRSPGDQAYHDLADELSDVTGKSDVVIAAITDGVVALDHKGKIQLMNPAAERIIGWSPADALELDYDAVLKLADNHDKPVPPENNPLHIALTSNKEVCEDSFSLITNDAGKNILANITATPLGGPGSGVIVVFRDITKERADEREQAEFISTASHEMRTPVASIEGYLGLALNPNIVQIDDKARNYITKAHESVQHLGRLFQDLLDISKVDDNRMGNNPAVVDVVPFVHDVIEGQLPAAKAKNLIVNYKPRPDFYEALDGNSPVGDRTISPVFYVNVDNDHLREVVGNLFENAIKYTLKGSVTVDVTGSDTHVIISVEDSGIGIPKEDLAHLFQKFYRVDDTDTREIGGTGLGLYLCRRLTETMGGKIWVESIYQQGSTFYIKLPRVDHVEAAHLIEASAERQQATIETKPAPLPMAEPTSEPVSELAPAPVAPEPVAVSNPPAAPLAPPAHQPATPVVTTPVAPPPATPEIANRPAMDTMMPQSPTLAPQAPQAPQADSLSLQAIEAQYAPMKGSTPTRAQLPQPAAVQIPVRETNPPNQQ